MMLVTSNIALNPADDTVWSIQPGNNELVQIGGGTAATPSLGGEQAASGQTLAEGFWLVVTAADDVTLVHSDGTEVAPPSGYVYPLSIQ